MTVRTLINALLDFDSDEPIEFYMIKNKKVDSKIIIDSIGWDNSLPYIIFKEDKIERKKEK